MKKYALLVFLVLTVSFLTYCFYPVIFYTSDNYNIWRIYLEDRNWIVITDKAKKWWYKLNDLDYNLDSKFIEALLIWRLQGLETLV